MYKCMNQNNKVLYEKKNEKKCEKTRYTSCMHIARHSSKKDLFLFFCGEMKKQCGYEIGSRNQEIR